MLKTWNDTKASLGSYDSNTKGCLIFPNQTNFKQLAREDLERAHAGRVRGAAMPLVQRIFEIELSQKGWRQGNREQLILPESPLQSLCQAF